MTQTPLIAIVCVLIASLLGAAGQYLFKAGVDRSGEGGLWPFLTSPWIVLGMLCYVSVMFFFTYAFRKGGTVTVLYPIYASTFIWSAFMGWWLYEQAIRPVHVLGMLFLVVGMYLMGIGNAQAPA